MKSRRERLLIVLSAAILPLSLAGCGQRLASGLPAETETESETMTETEAQTERVTNATESETQPIVHAVDYTSKDGTVKLTLPDNTWKVTQDADEMRVFSAGTSAMISIVHAATPSAMGNLSLMTSQDDLTASLVRQYQESSAFEVQSFDSRTYNGVNAYRYVVKYNAPARMWAYSVTYGIVAPEQAYVITGTVTTENQTLLTSVEDSVDSFQVLKDDTLNALAGAFEAGTTAVGAVGSTSTSEMATLKDYGYNATLYANDTVNVRMAPGTDSDVIGMVQPGAQVTVVGETATWFKVNINGNIGYIRKDFLVSTKPALETQQSESTVTDNDAINAELNTKTEYGGSVTLYASSEVNIRSQPGTSSDAIGSLAKGNSVSVVGETANWFIVSVNGVTGYISKAYLVSDSSMVPGDDTNAGNANGGDNGNENDNNGGNGENGNGNGNGGGTTGGTTYLQGTIVSSGMNYLTVAGDDGTTYTVYYGDANTSSVDGLYEGVYVGVTVDNSQTTADGTYYATNVQGF